MNGSGGGHGPIPTFAELLASRPTYPHFTKQLEEDEGKGPKFICTTPEGQALETKVQYEILRIKREMEAQYERVMKPHRLLMAAGIPTVLVDMSMETVINLMEHAKDEPVQDYVHLMTLMKDVTGEELGMVIDEENRSLNDSSNNGDNQSDIWSPRSEYSSILSQELLSVSKTKGAGHIMFPPPAQMGGHQMYTPMNSHQPNSVFHFKGAGSSIASTTSTNKAPRLLKPGEVAFSEGGSPLMMPRVGGPERRGEKIYVHDAEGKKVVELVAYRADSGNDKQYKEILTDIRGLAATKSIRREQVGPARIVHPKGPPSSKKAWH